MKLIRDIFNKLIKQQCANVISEILSRTVFLGLAMTSYLILLTAAAVYLATIIDVGLAIILAFILNLILFGFFYLGRKSLARMILNQYYPVSEPKLKRVRTGQEALQAQIPRKKVVNIENNKEVNQSYIDPTLSDKNEIDEKLNWDGLKAELSEYALHVGWEILQTFKEKRSA